MKAANTKSPKPSKSHNWTPKQLALLGKISDGAIARQLGLTTGTVYQKRNLLGIPSSRPRNVIPWTQKQIALLGKFPDTEVARRLNTQYKVVLNKRLQLGIECFARQSKLWHHWTDREIKLLGTDIDRNIAQRIGAPTMTVTTKRRNLKIPSFRKRKSTNRPAKPIDSWTAREIAILGTMTDKEAGEHLNLGQATVRLKRISLGIPPCRLGSQRRPGIWTKQIIARLGKESAASIAQDLGVSRQRVSQKIQELGISPSINPKP